MEAAFEMPPRRDAIDATVRALRAAAAPWLTPEAADGLEVAASEALTNIVVHGYAGGEAGRPAEVRVGMTVETRALRLEILDAGRSAPADLYDRVPALDTIDVLQESGRGCALIRHFAQTVDYRPAPGANRLTLTFARRADG